MSEVDPIFIKLDQLISISRLHEMALIMNLDRRERIARMMLVIRQLRQGAYLLGTGPSTVGIIPLTVDEVVLGRAATPAEKPAETVVDYFVADTMYFGPCEVSRVHAKIVRNGDVYTLLDLNSTCGTFANGEPVLPDGDGQPLSHGDVLSLGPSQISTYMFFVASSEDAFENGE